MPKVSDLTSASLPLTGAESVYLLQGGNSRKSTVEDVLDIDRIISRVKLQAAIAASGQTELAQTGIPSWANRLNIQLSLLSTSGTNNILLQVGAGSYVTSGYTCNAQGFTGSATAAFTSTAGFMILVDTASGQISGGLSLVRHPGNIWCIGNGAYRRSGTSTGLTTGEIVLGGDLDRLRLTTVGGTNTFDGGSASFSWE